MSTPTRTREVSVRRSAGAATAERGTRWPRFLVVLVLALVWVFPLYWMVVTALSTPAELYAESARLWPAALHWENFTQPLERWPFGRWFLNSTVIAVVSVVATLAVNLSAGYAFAKLDFPLKNTIFLAILSTLMVPVQVVMIGQFQLVVDLGLVNTDAGVVLPRLAEAFGLFLARQFFAAVPDELVEAARVDGAGPFRTFWSIVLPLSRPLIAVLVIFTFMWRWNEFAWPLIALQETDRFTLPIGLRYLQDQYGRDYGSLTAMSLLSVLPMLAVFAVFQRHFVEGMARTGLK